MSKFYGMVVGDRGETTRGGHHRIKSSVQSYDGSIITELTYSSEGQLMVDVSVGVGESTSYGRTIFHGTFEEYVAKLKQ